jgi:hypothetical protein
LQYAESACAAYGVPWYRSFGYINDLREAREPKLWYSGAFAAHVLNQALFFYHFPGSADEALARARFVLQSAKKSCGDAALIISPIPSWPFGQPDYPHDVLKETLSRLPIDESFVLKTEEHLYEGLRRAAEETGCLFLDTLPAFRAAKEKLYFDSELHIGPKGSKILGQEQAKLLLATVSTDES